MLYQSDFLMLKWTLKWDLLSFPIYSAVNNVLYIYISTTVLARQIMRVCVCGESVCMCVCDHGCMCVCVCVHVPACGSGCICVCVCCVYLQKYVSVLFLYLMYIILLHILLKCFHGVVYCTVY